MRPPILRLHTDEMIVDNFAGGGGASTGIKAATGRDPDIAVNHDPEALAVYKANHFGTRVMCEDVFDVKPRFVVGKRKVGLAWFSPDCTFFSKARGARPHRDRNKARRRRGLAGVVIKWAAQVRPRVICVENVEEFREWGPLGPDGLPDPARKGQSFDRWKKRLENLGYVVDLGEMRACDYGAPTSRKRLFIVARCDGQPIAWPQKTHGPGRALPYRTAAECIDWSIPCPSIFLSKREAKRQGFNVKRPLSDATLRRIARGVHKYVLDAAEPFVVEYHSPRREGDQRTKPLNQPLPTQDTSNRFGLVAPIIAPLTHQGGDRGQRADAPLPTITGAHRGEQVLIAPTLIQTSWGERPGQKPRALDLHVPLGTIMADGIKHSVVSAFLSKSYGGPGTLKERVSKQPVGRPMTVPTDTITAKDHHVLVSSSIVKLKGTCRDGQPVTVPLGTVQAQGNHYAEVRAFLVKYYGTDQDPQLGLPLHTVTTKHRFGLVTVTIAGTEYAIVDIGMRMLTPRELFNAQGFPRDYVIDPQFKGKRLSKTQQVHKCGNAVPPPFSEALVRAQFAEPAAQAAAR